METQPKSLPGEVRRQRILTLIKAQSFVRVTDLAVAFDISEVTVRSDLDQLVFGFVKNDYNQPDPETAIQVTAKWTCKSSEESNLEEMPKPEG